MAALGKPKPQRHKLVGIDLVSVLSALVKPWQESLEERPRGSRNREIKPLKMVLTTGTKRHCLYLVWGSIDSVEVCVLINENQSQLYSQQQ